MSTKSKRSSFMPRFSFKFPEKLRRISAVSGGSSGPPTPRTRGRRAAFSAIHFKKEKIMKQLQTAIEKGDSTQVEDVVDMVDNICDLEEGSLSFVTKACEHDNLDIIAILLRTGASVNSIPEGAQYAPLHIAARKGNTAMAAILLINSANPNCQTKYDKKTALHIAALEGHNEMVRLLVDNQADVNMGDIYGGSPLHIACRMGRQNIVETLLSHHADIDGYDNEGWTGLHLAAEAGHEHIVKLLLEANANINSQSKYGRTSLHWACVSGHVAVIMTLLQRGASANIKDRHDKLPLHYAKSDTIKTLVSARMDKTGPNKQYSSMVGLYFNPKPESSSHMLSASSHSRMPSVSRSLSSDPLMKTRSNRSSMTIYEAPDGELSKSLAKIHAHHKASRISNPVTIIVPSDAEDDLTDGLLIKGEEKENKLSLSTSFQKLVGTTSGHMEDIGNAMTELDTVLKLVLDKSIELTAESVTEYIAKVGDINENLKQMQANFSSETENVKTLISDTDKSQGLMTAGNPSYIALVQLFVQCLCQHIATKDDGWKTFLNCLPLGGDTSTILSFQLGLNSDPPKDKVQHVIMHWARSCEVEMTGSYMKTLLQTLQKCRFGDCCQVSVVLEAFISLETEFRSGEAENRSTKISTLVNSLSQKDVRHMYNIIDSSTTNLNVFPTLDELSVSESDSECPSKPNKTSSVKSQNERLEDLLKTIVEEEDQAKMVEAVKFLIMSGHEELVVYLL